MSENCESSCTTNPKQFYWIFGVNTPAFRFFREVDSTNDDDTIRSQWGLLASFTPQLDSAMGWYDAICESMKIRGNGIEERMACFDGSEREKAGICRSIALLVEEWDSFKKDSQMINEILEEYVKKLRGLAEGVQIEEEDVVKLIETDFRSMRLQQLDQGTQTEKDEVVKLTENHDVQEPRE